MFHRKKVSLPHLVAKVKIRLPKIPVKGGQNLSGVSAQIVCDVDHLT